MQRVPVPATYCGGCGERFRCAARRGEACRGVGVCGKTVACRELRWGGYQIWRSTPAPRLRCVVRQVCASPVTASCGGLDTAFRSVLQRVLARIRVFPALLR
jgi:hypothetical protein